VPYSDIGVRIGGLWIGPQAPVMHAISTVLRCPSTRTVRSNDSYRYFGVIHFSLYFAACTLVERFREAVIANHSELQFMLLTICSCTRTAA
jgi:hypothetical protein